MRKAKRSSASMARLESARRNARVEGSTRILRVRFLKAIGIVVLLLAIVPVGSAVGAIPGALGSNEAMEVTESRITATDYLDAALNGNIGSLLTANHMIHIDSTEAPQGPVRDAIGEREKRLMPVQDLWISEETRIAGAIVPESAAAVFLNIADNLRKARWMPIPSGVATAGSFAGNDGAWIFITCFDTPNTGLPEDENGQQCIVMLQWWEGDAQ